MKVIFSGLKPLATKFAGKAAAKTVFKRMFLSSFCNIFVNIVVWAIEFFLHPFMKEWRDALMQKLRPVESKEPDTTES